MEEQTAQSLKKIKLESAKGSGREEGGSQG